MGNTTLLGDLPQTSWYPGVLRQMAGVDPLINGPVHKERFYALDDKLPEKSLAQGIDGEVHRLLQRKLQRTRYVKQQGQGKASLRGDTGSFMLSKKSVHANPSHILRNTISN